MAVRNRNFWTRLESQARIAGDDASVNAQYRTGALQEVPPARVQGLTATSGVGEVTFSWSVVTRTAAGKPLEALARYLLFYKKGTSSPIPHINPNDPATYDEVVYVDNTRISISVGRQYVDPPGEWRDEIIAARVLAIDRQHRKGKASAQVEGAALATRVPQTIDVGYIESYNPNDPNDQLFSIVWDFPNYTVPNGYSLIAAVWPLQGTYLIPGDLYADLYGWIEQHYYGLFYADELPVPVPILPAGTYTNLRLVIYHYFFGAGFFTCLEGTNALLPQYNFDYSDPGNMNISGYLTEAVTAVPGGLGTYGFQHVMWMVWMVSQ